MLKANRPSSLESIYVYNDNILLFKTHVLVGNSILVLYVQQNGTYLLIVTVTYIYFKNITKLSIISSHFI